MVQLELLAATKENIMRQTGLGIETIVQDTTEALDTFIFRRYVPWFRRVFHKKLPVVAPQSDSLLGRGCVLLHRLTYREDANRALGKI